eukprot:TRINITY_DN1754_c1_g1_i3.p1 TRINITY_DN1754_c1_g1~~TRINITY_DN1754_c1_g1_i3.p1  ORF type:complete len:1056 (+),score=235.21 TRINITY_DN1754_c1_g1_i3:280-3168(+)
MKGASCLWVPGTDHAGIATQTVVERQLQSTGIKSRHDLGREEFVSKIWDWKETYGNQIVSQLMRTGASLDWDMNAFTLDKQRELAVRVAFNKLHKDGKIYRAQRLVNWCPYLQSVISDIEVDHEQVEGRTYLTLPTAQRIEVGVLYTIKYPLKPLDGGDVTEHLIVSTTRPETIIGDTALAIHPEDDRYKAFHGRQAINPITGRVIPIVTDNILVDITFGTGVVKVTPAHDANDFSCAERHGLPAISVFDVHGKINENAPENFRKMDRFDARKLVMNILTEKDLFVEKKSHAMAIARCSRTNDIIEPMLMYQWFLDTKELASDAVHAVRSGEISMHPQSAKQDWYNWLERDQRDWCISRQLWWGHRIPAWKYQKAGETEEDWIVALTQEEALKQAKLKYGDHVTQDMIIQDPDVLDTWFSSALFPISTLGWPWNAEDSSITDANHPAAINPEFASFYPLSVMETGSDILFFWVARMVMLCKYFTNEVPFRSILLHAMVRDAEGRKMSKSLGNVIDPIQVIEGVTKEEMINGISSNLASQELERAKKSIATNFPTGIKECGTDALRFTLAMYTQQGKSINLDVSRIVANRHFCNKIWQATKFCLRAFEGDGGNTDFFARDSQWNPALLLGSYEPENESHVTRSLDLTFDWDKDLSVNYTENKESLKLDLISLWILNSLENSIISSNASLSRMDLSDSAQGLHSFFWYDFCDEYLEFAKLILKYSETSEDGPERSRAVRNVLYTNLECSLRLLHPFMPFVTEKLWQNIKISEKQPPSVMIAPYPLPSPSPSWAGPKVINCAKTLIEITSAIRSLNKSYGITDTSCAVCTVHTSDSDLFKIFNSEFYEYLIRERTKIGKVKVEILKDDLSSQQDEVKGTRIIDARTKIVMDYGSEKEASGLSESEKQKFTKDANTLEASIEKMKTQMAGSNYAKAPVKIREQHAVQLADMEKQLSEIKKLLGQAN